MTDPLDKLGKIRALFYELVEKLPGRMEGLQNLISDVFWDLVALGSANPQTVSNPATWADEHVYRWVSDFYEYHEFENEFGLSYEEYEEIRVWRTSLVGQATMELSSRAWTDAKPVLTMIKEAGKVRRNPELRKCIAAHLKRLVLVVFEARRSLKLDTTAKTLRENFPELATITDGERDIVLRRQKVGRGSYAVAREIAAELAGNRCGLRVASVLKYDQGNSERSNKKRN